MAHHVTAQIVLDIPSPVELILAIAPTAATPETETLSFHGPTAALTVTPIIDVHRGRLHQVHAPAGSLTIDYAATVDAGKVTESLHLDPADRIRYLRPSRYSQSDLLFSVARTEFAGVAEHELVPTVRDWVASHLHYVPGVSKPTDSAVETYLARAGVCRDFAHLTIALLRAMDVPARMVSVYAPGLDPMDFHAVTEAWTSDRWITVDATGLAPRHTMLRIATGRDAADTAFLTSHGNDLTLTSLFISATVDDFSVEEDAGTQVQLPD